MILVLGSGESGVGSALLAKSKGLSVFVSESNMIEKKYKELLLNNDIQFEENGHLEADKLNVDYVIKSPGIPDTAAIIKKFVLKQIQIISEIEFASKFTDATIIGVTGSNGKTTTATIIYEILKSENIDVDIAGNIGVSFASKVAASNTKNYVLELSSFQLDGIIDLNPHIAIMTNLSPDHLDRYNNSFENYINSKFNIIKNQSEKDYFIYDLEDVKIVEFIKNNNHKIKSNLLPFSTTKTKDSVTYLEDNNIISIINKNKIIMPTNNFPLIGTHNLKNAMAATTVANLLKIRKETIRKSLEHFQAVEHRLEHVLKINKVNYINDSKATNVNAAYYALDSMQSSTVWIVGGIDKGNKYEELFSLVNEKVKAIICLGKDNKKIFENFENLVEYITEVKSMSEAVKEAYTIAKSNDNVLLSPACASFDLFKNYEDRGEQFKAEVRKL
ncbi:UDP-N-acetylmuramoyl-L-alanine--D-glutamate ligase [Flavobacteriaceae bacterium]|nr:UDP-N-acetylmuramoyl-L-alanine--D-glutamate ligase [Flavobacteriaceae bacterium]MDC1310151.1 UDP-N-acetylmuramoyl-L-alanine--D-glutamate ligase [Flavobacteriaceae bacterium]